MLNEPVAVFLTLITVILITPLISEWIRLPGIVGLMLGGMLVGPHGLNLLTTSRTIELFSTVGLIYLMFSAGLEIDLHQFARVRNKSMAFGFLTFIIPEVSGIALGRLIGLDWGGAILLGSVYASHTLVAFPILSRLGILRNESVSVTIGATVFTDVLALLVLAIIAGSHGEEASLSQVVRLIILVIGYAVIILLGFPRLGKLFFRRFSGRAVEFQFVLVSLFVAAFLAEVIGMHAIVGAFMAGLAINSTLPPRSRVTGQVLFLGESFFIPIFLMYIGMVLDPVAILADTQTLKVGIALTAAVYATKYTAAWIAARLFGYSAVERMNMWGLSQAQAAATLATVLVGVEVGLFPQTVFNGAILMVLFTVITSSLIVQRYGARIQPHAEHTEPRPRFNRILVPVANPSTEEHLISLASILARTGKGTLYPVHVAQEIQGRVYGLEHQRRLFESEALKQPETHIQPISRVDSSVARGIIRSAIENRASLIVMGWRGRSTFSQSVFGTVLDEVVWDAPVPVLVGRLTISINAMEKVVLVIPKNSMDLEMVAPTLQMVSAIARALNVPLLILPAGQYADVIRSSMDAMSSQVAYDFNPLGGNVVADVTQYATRQDLIVVTTTGSRSRFRSSLGSIPEEIAAARQDSIVVIHFADPLHPVTAPALHPGTRPRPAPAV